MRFSAVPTLLSSLALAAVLAGSSTGVSAQIVASPSATLTQTISGTDFELAWSRPSLRDRGEPFGDIVEFDGTWTGGANNGTTLRLSKDVTLGGVEVPAGRYSIWLEVVDSDDWRVMLHADTTLFHSAHPPIDDAQIVVPARRERVGESIETLEWRFEDIVWNGATLTLAWGVERVRMPLVVDPGIRLDVSEEEANLYVGTWVIDDSADRPPLEQIEGMLADPGTEGITRLYFEALRDVPTSREIEILFDAADGRLYRSDPGFHDLWAMFLGIGEGDPRFELLVPRSPGIFAPTIALGGELLSFDPEFGSFMEFTFGDDGRAISFETRGGDDEVTITGRRVGG